MNIVIGTALLLGLAVWFRRLLGPDRMPEALSATWRTLAFTLPRICVALIGAGFFAELLPGEKVQSLFGPEAGILSFPIAAALGVLTPGGAFVSFAIAAAALQAGADIPAVLSYVTAWALFSLSRTLAYEAPMMGGAVVRLRFLVSWPIPIAVGLAALLLLRLVA